MTSYLLLLSAQRATRHQLSAGDLSIGSGQGCDLVLFEKGVSPQHAVIHYSGEGEAIIVGVEGKVLINGVESKRRALAGGDEIRIGAARIQFLQEFGEPEVQLTKVARSPDSLERLTPDQQGEAIKWRIGLLVRMASAVGSGRSYQDVLDELMEITFQAIKPERAVLALVDGEQLRFEAARHTSARDPWQDLQVSGTILGRVISRAEAFITTDARLSEEMLQVHSVARKGIRSAMCVPFYQRGKVIGALYADHRDTAHCFNEDDLDFLILLSHLASSTLQNVVEYQAMQAENQRLRTGGTGGEELIGESETMQLLRRNIQKVAKSDLPILITGERGTGKELTARAIHIQSIGGPFIAVNCAAIPESLAESALFGHEKGSFTGADQRHRGFFEQANGGTLFLDEIGDLKLSAQAAILRALQEGEIQRVGAPQVLKVKVRIISATNRNLSEAIAGGTFRGDLFDRLNVLPVRVPPLRERLDDVPLLAAFFSTNRVRKISARSLNHLQGYDWPGNVRELQNTIDRAVVMGDGETIWPEDLPPVMREARPERVHLASLDTLEKDHLIRVLRFANGNISKTAEILAVGRITIYKKLKKYGLEASDFKTK